MNLLSKYLIRKAIAKNKSYKEPISFNNAKSIVIVYDFDKQFTKLNLLKAHLKEQTNKAIKFIGFSSKRRSQLDASEEGVICREDFGFFLQPKTTYLKREIVERTDLMINLANDHKESLHIFIALSRAKQIAGKGSYYAKQTDFILNDEKALDMIEYTQSVIDYLNKIK